ncbi:hypothetical protein ACTXHN_21940 [Bacillus licheniformis]|uniref:hypothetical protein n=1 Tax=Bacillus licheniformis TaxID=1402 RepID=UPI00404522AE
MRKKRDPRKHYPVSYWKSMTQTSLKNLFKALEEEAKRETEEKRQIEKMING